MAGQVWVNNTLGGYMSAQNLSKHLRYALKPTTKFRQFCDVKDASQQGKKKGDKFHWDVFSKVATAGGTLVETNTMPETNFTITQGTLTITEYGNSVPYSGKLDDLSELPVKTIINEVLAIDAQEAFDTAAAGEFGSTLLRCYPTAGTSTVAISLATTGTVGGTASVALNTGHVKAILDAMKERNIPPYAKDDYYAISWPTTLRTFKNSLESINMYTPEGFQLIKNGEVGRYEGCRFVEQTFIAKAGTTYTDWCYFFGKDTCAEGIAVPEEMRGKLPQDYGRDKGVAWYYLGGFGLVHTAAAQTRIVKWESLA